MNLMSNNGDDNSNTRAHISINHGPNKIKPNEQNR